MVDWLIAILTVPIAPLLWLLSRLNRRFPATRWVLDRTGVSILRHHYYAPIVFPSDIMMDLDAPRRLPGLDLDIAGQLSFIGKLRFNDELLAIPVEPTRIDEFAYHNGSFEAGDAEMLYNMIRHFEPKQLVEIGCGQSTLIALLAQKRNRADCPTYSCRHVCVEPYEHPWLERTGVELIRTPIERVDTSLVACLEANDILFIDSSHTIRPQGDVVHTYLHLLGLIRPGVLVHVHDIFTPRNYPPDWVLGERRLWNEQYLLEAVLSFTREFEVLAALNCLNRAHRNELAAACPVLAREPDREPGSFWFRKRREV